MIFVDILLGKDVIVKCDMIGDLSLSTQCKAFGTFGASQDSCYHCSLSYKKSGRV